MATAARRFYQPPSAPVFWRERFVRCSRNFSASTTHQIHFFSYSNAEMTQAGADSRPEGFTQFLRLGDESQDASPPPQQQQSDQQPSPLLQQQSPQQQPPLQQQELSISNVLEHEQARAEKRHSVAAAAATPLFSEDLARKRRRDTELQLTTVDPFEESTRRTPRLSTTPVPLSMSIENCMIVFGQIDEQVSARVLRPASVSNFKQTQSL